MSNLVRNRGRVAHAEPGTVTVQKPRENNSMKAIILSAGQGRRLLPLTQDTPKCALPVLGRSVLEWQLNEIARVAVDEVVVVSGFGANAVDEIAAQPHGVPVRTLYNPFYGRCDNLGTCWVARSEMTGPFVIINGDTLFEAAILDRLLATTSPAPVTLVTDHKGRYDDDDMKVVTEDGRLRRVGKQLDSEQVNGESIGMMMFHGMGPDLFSRRVEHLMRHGEGLKQWYLSAIDDLAQQNHVRVCPIDGLSWCEIDDRADLEHAATVLSSWYADGKAASAG
jgi:choline kinase